MSKEEEYFFGELTVDTEFASLVPALTGDESRGLEESLLKHGCRDHLLAWQSDGKVFLVDGHHRHEICKRLGLPYRVQRQQFPDRSAVVKFIIANQLARRNLTDAQKSELRGQAYNFAKKPRGGDKKTKGQVDPLIAKSTAERLGEQFGVSSKKIKRDGKFAEAVDKIAAANPAAKAPIMAGDVKLPAQAVVDVLKMDDQQLAAVAHAVVTESVKSVADVTVTAAPKMPGLLNDPNGVPIPTKLQPVFDCKCDFRAIVQQLGKTLSAIEALRNTPAGVFLAERFGSIETDIANAQHAIKFSAPHQVCPYCNGVGCKREGAAKTACRETGWTTRLVRGPGK